jgi:hypothetical protein
VRFYRKTDEDARFLTAREPETVFYGLDIPDDVFAELKANIARRLTPQPVKIRADIEVSNFAYDGILRIQEALAAGEALSTDEIPIKIRLIAPPLYVMVSHTTDKQGAIDRLEQAIEKIGEVIRKEDGGFLNVKLKPKAVSETDDLELAALMDRVARENAEISGPSLRSLFLGGIFSPPDCASSRTQRTDSMFNPSTQATRTRRTSKTSKKATTPSCPSPPPRRSLRLRRCTRPVLSSSSAVRFTLLYTAAVPSYQNFAMQRSH